MKKTKKLISVLLAVIMFMSVVPMMGITANAANKIEGTDISWSYSSGELRITGKGKIPSYITGEDTPWYKDYQTKVTSISIGEGITDIGRYAFYDMGKQTGVNVELYLPSTIKNIESRAFESATITTVILSPETDESLVIKSDAFTDNAKFKYIKFSDDSYTGKYFKIVDNVLYTEDGKEIVCIPTAIDNFTPSSEVEKIPSSDKVSFDGFFNSTNIDKDLTVDVISFKDGTSSSDYYMGELLEATVTSKSGKSTDDLYYGWVMLSGSNGSIQNTGYYDYISGFDNSDLSNSDEIQFSKTARWASTKGKQIINYGIPCYFALVVCRKDGSGNYNIVGKRQFSVAPYSDYDASASLEHCVKSNTVTMFKGETLSLKQLLERCGITHTTCSHASVSNAQTDYTGMQYLTVSGYSYYINKYKTKNVYNITANEAGRNIEVMFDFSVSSCLYHANSSITSTENTLYINIVDPVTTDSDCEGFAITNPVSGYDYTIGNQKGTLSDDGKIIFDNLTENTDYTLKLTLTGKYGAAAAQVTEKVTTGSFEHTYSSNWTYDSTQHWHAATCAHSDEKTGVADHTGMEDGICDVCGYKIPNVSKEVETEDSITVSDESNTAIQNYVDSQGPYLIYDTKYKFAVKEQEPADNAKKTAIEDIAGTKRTVTFFDATFTKTETVNNVAQSPVEIEDTGDTVLSFTVAYDMTGKCNLGVFRYHGTEATELTRVYTASNPKDGTYYVEGSGANTKVTVFASKFSAYALGSTVLPEVFVDAGYSAYLTLSKNIDISLMIKNLGTDKEGTGFDGAKLSITVGGETWTDYTVSGGVLSGVIKSVEPKDVGTDPHIAVIYDGVTVKDFNYSVMDYCKAVFALQAKDKALETPTGQYDKLAALCEALLNYGKWAEDYYNETNSTGKDKSTINEGHVKDFTGYDFGEIEDVVVNGTAGLANLSIDSKITLKYYVSTDTNLTTGDDEETQNFFVVNGEGKQIDPQYISVSSEGCPEGYNQVVSIELYADQLPNRYTLRLRGVDTSKFCIIYGVYNYCKDVQEYDVKAYPKFTDTLKTLCKAIHNYGQAVKAYIA